MGEGLPGSHPHAKFYHFGLVDVGLRPKKSPKMVIFGKNLPLGKNSWESIGKLEHRCTTTNLPLCNDTIIVLKLICIIAFPLSQTSSFQSVIRNRQTKKHHIFFVYSRRATHDPHHTSHGDSLIEEVRPIFAPHNFF